MQGFFFHLKWQETEQDQNQEYNLTQGLENLFQQIQDCTHINLSIPAATVSAPALSVVRAEVPRSFEDQGGSVSS